VTAGGSRTSARRKEGAPHRPHPWHDAIARVPFFLGTFVDDHGCRFVAEIKHRLGVSRTMIVGRSPRMPVIGDNRTVARRPRARAAPASSLAQMRSDTRFYWRDGRDTLGWYVRRELTVPRIDYDG